MKKMGLNQIREEYLKFFESKEHLRLKSFPLIPQNDKSLLLINAGMAPLKPYFTGVQTPPKTRITTCQKCIRTGDIENVGKTSRHATFFEMLGNFSFGDYFKKEIIPWAWEFVTTVLELPKDKLYVTIYLEDDEAYDIWVNNTDVDKNHIFRLGKEDNFWEHGAGPCGPCTEIHFNRGNAIVTSVDDFLKASDEDKVVEFWNLVFTQFDGDGHGNYERLKNPNIDTGMGLERMATIMQGVDNIFEVDTIKSILNKASEITGAKYGEDKAKDMSLRIITDHIRSTSFMICDGVLPSNEGRGYVLRRLLRRAARHARKLGVNKACLYKICEVVIENSKGSYPELEEKRGYIEKIIKLEEERFEETIDSGLNILNEYIDELEKAKKNLLEGEKAFKLYDTYGFPMELTEEILEEKGMKADLEGFNIAMKEQRERARNARAESNYMGAEDTAINKIPKDINTIFVGYNNIYSTSKVLTIISNDEFVDELNEGEEGVIVTSETPFYAEMGGQIGDTGFVENDNFKGYIINCKKNIGGKVIHFVKAEKGTLALNDNVNLTVDEHRRNAICKNHTATHMLQEALKEVLGDHIHQAGSYVDNERLRFDFTHFSAVTLEELKKVELIVNKQIMNVLVVNTDEMTIEEAKKAGAVALFNEKYSEKVRVVSVGDFSKELCGGTHAKNSGEIGLFKIVSEAGVAAGIRRIEAVTGIGALKFVEEQSNLLNEVSTSLKCGEKEINIRIAALKEEIKNKEKEISELKSKFAEGAENDILNSKKNVKGINVITGIVRDIDGDSLRNLGDKIRNKENNSLVLLASINEEKISFLAMASKDSIEKGIHAGKIVKEVAAIAGGGGGGRPDMAQAGGKNLDKVEEAVSKVYEIVEKIVK